MVQYPAGPRISVHDYKRSNGTLIHAWFFFILVFSNLLFSLTEFPDPLAPLPAFFYISVANILPAQVSERVETNGSNTNLDSDEEREEGEEDVTPFILRELIGKKFRVGPSGAIIGHGRGCTVHIPKVAQVAEQHAKITWCRSGAQVPDNAQSPQIKVQDSSGYEVGNDARGDIGWADLSGHGVFQLHDLTGGQTKAKQTRVRRRSTLSMLRDDQEEAPTLEEEEAQAAAADTVDLPADVRWQLVFATGRIEWAVQPMLAQELASACVFAAVRSGKLDLVQRVVEAAKRSGGITGKTAHTVT